MPFSELARAKMKMALGQLPDLPFSSSLRVLVPVCAEYVVHGESGANVIVSAATYPSPPAPPCGYRRCR